MKAAVEVAAVLSHTAQEHRSKAVSRRGLASAMLAEPDVDHVAEAHRLRSWAADRDVRDVVATYRNWLKRADRVAQPIAAAMGGPNVVAMRPARRGSLTADLEHLAAIARGEA